MLLPHVERCHCGHLVIRCHLDNPKVEFTNTRKHCLHLRFGEAVHTGNQRSEQCAVFVKHGVITILKQGCLIDLYLATGNASAVNAAAEHPVDGAVTMIGTAVSVLSKSATEFTDDDHDGVAPRTAQLVGKCREPAAKFLQTARQIAGGGAFADVRVPAPTSPKPRLNLSRIRRPIRRASSSNPLAVTALRLAASISVDISRITSSRTPKPSLTVIASRVSRYIAEMIPLWRASTDGLPNDLSAPVVFSIKPASESTWSASISAGMPTG